MSNLDKWDLYNQFTLYGDADRFTKLLARYELFRMVLDIPGDIVEGGVLKGAGVFYWAKLIQIFNPLSKRRVVGFDTFEGYPETNTSRDDDKRIARAFTKEQISAPGDVSTGRIMQIAEEQGLSNRIELVKGDVSSTVETYVQGHPGFRVALLNLDFVLYDPTLAALKHLYERVVRGGVIVLDEYAVADKSESNAVDEFLGRGARLQSFPWAKSPTAYFIKE